MRRVKVIVIGAGPAGGACALTLAKRGGTDIHVLDKSSYPRIKVCGSGLSPHALKILDKLEIREKLESMHLHMVGITAKGPGGTSVHLRGAKGAWVVPRVEFDNTIIREAERLGARFEEETKVTKLVRDEGGNVRGVETTRGNFEADLVICANGSPSRFETDTSPRYGIRTIMGWWKGTERRAEDEGVMIWDRRLDGYYAWLFPEPHGVVNIGLTIPEQHPQAKRLKALFQEILDDHFAEEVRHADQVGKWMGHPATVTTKIGRVCERHALWCGEAARLVSPGTVEGIGFAMESGMLAAESVARDFTTQRGMSRAAQARYRGRLRMRMLPKFWAGEAFTKLMRSPRGLSLAKHLLDPQKLSERAARVVGETQ